jgi:hypothetical protein
LKGFFLVFTQYQGIKKAAQGGFNIIDR